MSILHSNTFPTAASTWCATWGVTRTARRAGLCRQVGADAQDKPEASSQQMKAMQDTAYRALIYLSGSHLESQGRQMKLVPGMQVNAEIHLGTRSDGNRGAPFLDIDTTGPPTRHDQSGRGAQRAARTGRR